MIKGECVYLEGGGTVQLGRVDCVRRNVGDVGYELLQEVAALLQVGGVDDHLHQLNMSSNRREGHHLSYVQCKHFHMIFKAYTFFALSVHSFDLTFLKFLMRRGNVAHIRPMMTNSCF